MARRGTGTPATVTLTAAGVAFTSHPYSHDSRSHDSRSASYGLEAAAALGLDPALVFKTLVALVDASPVVAIVPVSGSLDLKSLAAVRGGRRAELADAATASRLTGYVLGGISPLGQRRTLPTVLDESARTLPTVYVSGGRRGFDIGLSPDDLLTLTAGQYAAIARDERS